MLAQRFVTTPFSAAVRICHGSRCRPFASASFGSKEKPTTNADKSSSNERSSLWNPSLDLGEIATGEKGKGTVTLTNGGKAAVVLTKVQTSCGCTTANCPEGQTIEPGGTVEVSISLDGGTGGSDADQDCDILDRESSPGPNASFGKIHRVCEL